MNRLTCFAKFGIETQNTLV